MRSRVADSTVVAYVSETHDTSIVLASAWWSFGRFGSSGSELIFTTGMCSTPE